VAGEKDRPHGCGVCEVKVEGCLYAGRRVW
jgi:hypothetical protein